MATPRLIHRHRQPAGVGRLHSRAERGHHAHVGGVDQEHRCDILRQRVVHRGLGIAECQPCRGIDLGKDPYRLDTTQDHRHQQRLVQVPGHCDPIAGTRQAPKQCVVSVGRAVHRETGVVGTPQAGGQLLGPLQVPAGELKVIRAAVQRQVEREQRIAELR